MGLGFLYSGTWHWSWNDAVIGDVLILLLLAHIYERCIFFATIYLYIRERRNEFMSYVKI
jgi:hypothetical protein